jgi:pyrrolysine biosynthesis protein PylC
MRIAIIGAELHGIETAYLAKKAGYETFVIGKRKEAPALSLADEHLVMGDVPESRAVRMVGECDAAIPACENVKALSSMVDLLKNSGVPLLFDINAHTVTSSKIASNALMEKIGIPTPRRWQECGYPVIVKPSSQSGGAGVTIAYNGKEVNGGIEKVMRIGDEPLIQEYVPGRCVSIDVIGDGRRSRTLVVTEGSFDRDHDCKIVRCSPNILTEEKEREFRRIARRLAEVLDLGSVMSVEAIDSENGLKVMEMDARIPTQAPSAVLAATGLNLLKEMVGPQTAPGKAKENMRASSYEHLIVKDGRMSTCGEREFAGIRNPSVIRGLFGSDEMITDYVSGAAAWRCAMINSAASEEELERKRAECIRAIVKECGIREYSDSSPLLR